MLRKILPIVFSVVVFVSCESLSKTKGESSTISLTDISNTSISIASTFREETKMVFPTSTAEPTITPKPPTSIPVTLSFKELNGLQMAYVANGNIYFQKGADAPIQLTHEGNNLFPTFSDDGEKFVFLRGLVPRDLYSVGLDGEIEQLLISGNILNTVAQEYNELSELRSFAFVPETHSIVFNTLQLGEDDVKNQDWNRTSSRYISDLLVLDLDTREIAQLLPPGQGGNFAVSPDGNLIAVQGDGRIDIISIGGQMVHKNLVTYIHTKPYTLNPRMFWTSDSTELIVSLPVRDVFDLTGPETPSLWRFTIDGSRKTEIILDPPLLDVDFEVSPDGNWILYNYFYYPGKTDESITSGLYLGNLHDGSSQLYAQGTALPIWNPNSIYFVFDGPFLGSIDSGPVSLGRGRFLGWLDVSHYLFYQSETEDLLIAEINGGEVSIPHTIPANSFRSGPAVFSFVFFDSD